MKEIALFSLLKVLLAIITTFKQKDTVIFVLFSSIEES